MALTRDAIEQARHAMAPHVERTPLRTAEAFAVLVGASVHLKVESLQRTSTGSI